MNQKLKIRSYAIFQFISFIALFSLLLSDVLIAFVISHKVGIGGTLFDSDLWDKYIIEVMLFKSEEIGILASILIYISIILFILSWISGLMILKIENRNLFDSLFLLFLIVPIVSNIFAFFGQVTTKEIKLMSSKVDKKQITEEQTRIIENELSNESSN